MQIEIAKCTGAQYYGASEVFMIRAHTKWNKKMQFTGEAGGNAITLDTKAPLGDGTGPSPKELVAIGICGCTGMDVVSLLKKYKQPLESLDINIEVETTQNIQPAVFKSMQLVFAVTGNIEKEKLIEAVHLSQTRYCGVSAMIVKAAPLEYKIILNGEEISTGKADFKAGL